MLRDPYLINSDRDIHLRDARHAHQLYTQHGHALSPKVKFLYHVVFEYIGTNGNLQNSREYNKEIGVLVKNIDLPKFKAEVTTKNQYNRKKNVQTRVDYNPVNISFHDDNSNVTRFLLQEYYQYYFRDGNKKDPNGRHYDFDPRDKYLNSLPRYGLDNDTIDPFFNTIKIYQLAKRNWASYTLVNPLVTDWGHDQLDNSDGSGIMANSISCVYESVIYNNGVIREQSEPVNFTDPETRYDVVKSPLTRRANEPKVLGTEPSPSERNFSQTFSNNVPVIINKNRKNGSTILDAIRNSRENRSPGGLPQIVIPKTNTQEEIILTSSINQGTRSLATNTINQYINNPAVINSVIRQALSTGSFNNNYNVDNFSDYQNLPVGVRNAIQTEVIERSTSGSDKKMQQIASNVVRTFIDKGISV